MKDTFFLFILICLLSACQSNSNHSDPVSNLIDSGDFNQIDDLKKYLNSWEGESKDLSAKVLEASNFLISENRFDDAVEIMKNYLSSSHFDLDSDTSIVRITADIYENNYNRKRQAEIIRARGANEIDGTPTYIKVRNIGRSVFSEEKGFDKDKAREFVDAAEYFSIFHPNDSLAPVFLIDAATISRNLGEKEKTVELFKRVYEKFPNHPKAPEAMFFEAFTYDADMKDFEKARIAYTNFMTMHPNHPFAQQAKVMVENLGKSDEELLEALSKQK